MSRGTFTPCREPDRPTWSVMIPAHDAKEEHLRRALDSVVAQARADGLWQIAVLDDGTSAFCLKTWIERRGSTFRIEHRRSSRGIGLARSWNECIEHARGDYVHLLHQDDYVLPGFYDAMERGLGDPSEPQAAFCPALVRVESTATIRSHNPVRQRTSGILADWLHAVFERLAIQTPAIVVRRRAYEDLGGFDDAWRYVVDWDMWKRIASRYPIWYHREPLAVYRMHSLSETSRLMQSGADLAEIDASIVESASLLEPSLRARVVRRARRSYMLFGLEGAVDLLCAQRSPTAALRRARQARRLGRLDDFCCAVAKLTVRGAVRLCGPRPRRLVPDDG